MAVAATSWMRLPPWQLPVLLLALWPLLQASHGLGCAAVAWARTRHLAAQADAIAERLPNWELKDGVPERRALTVFVLRDGTWQVGSPQ